MIAGFDAFDRHPEVAAAIRAAFGKCAQRRRPVFAAGLLI